MDKKYEFKNGKVMAPNAVFMGYLFLGVSVFVFLANPLMGIGMFLVACFASFTTYGTELDLAHQELIEYTKYLGVLKIYKSISYKGHSVITVLPASTSYRMYSRSSNGTTSTDYYFTITLFNEHFRKKLSVGNVSTREEAIAKAKELAVAMGMEYFEYSPQAIREKLNQR